ncbi:hypothetical protein V5O48_018248, partial [Marasmius crinis-equi]
KKKSHTHAQFTKFYQDSVPDQVFQRFEFLMSLYDLTGSKWNGKDSSPCPQVDSILWVFSATADIAVQDLEDWVRYAALPAKRMADSPYNFGAITFETGLASSPTLAGSSPLPPSSPPSSSPPSLLSRISGISSPESPRSSLLERISDISSPLTLGSPSPFLPPSSQPRATKGWFASPPSAARSSIASSSKVTLDRRPLKRKASPSSPTPASRKKMRHLGSIDLSQDWRARGKMKAEPAVDDSEIIDLTGQDDDDDDGYLADDEAC